MKILITCPPMIAARSEFEPVLDRLGVVADCPEVKQTLAEDELTKLVPEYDGWIIGDDPATRTVLTAGRSGRLRAAVKWGVGTDNVDLQACADLGIAIDNTPGIFGDEVGDMVVAYLVGLARGICLVDRQVRRGLWPKPAGTSLAGKTAGVVGFGNIGQSVSTRLSAMKMKTIAYVPDVPTAKRNGVEYRLWPTGIGDCNFLILACPLTPETRHMLDAKTLSQTMRGVMIINVSRGALIDEAALDVALSKGHVQSAALDVFETEPLPSGSPLRRHDQCVFGTHNASNTVEAVESTNRIAIGKLMALLGREES